MKSGRTKTTDSAQRKRFIETARALECDEDKGGFEEKLGRIAKARRPLIASGRDSKRGKPTK